MTIKEYAEKHGIEMITILEPLKNPVDFYRSAGFPKKIKNQIMYCEKDDGVTKIYIKFYNDRGTRVLLGKKEMVIDCYDLVSGYFDLKQYSE